MKKIFALAFVLALVAIMAVPMAASAATGTGGTTVGGSVLAGTITVAPPSAISFVLLNASPTATEDAQSATPGRVTVVPGTSGKTAWTMTAKSTAGTYPGYLATGATKLDQPLLIAKTLGSWYLASGNTGTTLIPPLSDTDYFTGTGTTVISGALSYAGAVSVTDIFLYAKQWVNSSDSTAGAYSCTITFTAIITDEI